MNYPNKTASSSSATFPAVKRGHGQSLGKSASTQFLSIRDSFTSTAASNRNQGSTLKRLNATLTTTLLSTAIGHQAAQRCGSRDEPPKVPVSRPREGTTLHLPQSSPVKLQHLKTPQISANTDTHDSLSRPSLVTQHPLQPPLSSPATTKPFPVPASLAYTSASDTDTNPAPFLLSPVVNLPVSFGSAYVGETFSCTLCANNDLSADAGRTIRDVRIEAEMKTPGVGRAQKLELRSGNAAVSLDGTDLDSGQTLQGVVGFDLKEEGNHVLAVTVSYYETSETSGRTRTFRKLYQFICKSSLIVRTKMSSLASGKLGRRRWVLEAQLENCSEDVMQLEKVVMDVEDGLRYAGCNWETSGGTKPVLHPGEVEQVCFVVETLDESGVMKAMPDGRLVFGVLGIRWRGGMGNRGFLSTGKLGTKVRS